MDSTFERFCLVLSQVPKGRVCSYRHLAIMAELGGPRQSSRLLQRLPVDSALPWFRIVSAQGKLADYASAGRQRRLLENDGIIFTASGRIPKHYFL